MLLGIALHAALSFAPIPWPVQDSHQNGLFLLGFVAIHGFRMPLFFLLSGFFTAMLWRRRGLGATISQRLKRIALPLALGLVTIVPLVNYSMRWGMDYSRNRTGAQAADDSSLVASVRTGQADGVTRWLAEGADPDQRDPGTQVPALAWAAFRGDTDTAAALLAAGADPNIQNLDGATPLHGAAFFGRPGVVAQLLEAGADPSTLSKRGESPLDAARSPAQLVPMVAGILKITPPEEAALMKGREAVARLLDNAASMPADRAESETAVAATWRERYFDFIDSPHLTVPNPMPGTLEHPLHVFNGSLFSHLWFLWHLCWLMAMFSLYAWLADSAGFTGLPRWLVLSPARWLWILPLSVLLQTLMHHMQPGFGPDTYASLLPAPHLLAYYGLFYFFGAFYFDAGDDTGRVGRWWPVTLPLALIVLMPATFVLSALERPTAAATCETLYAWLMTFGLMGLCRRVLNTERPAVRYVSDSSYWLYLIHMPLVFVAQAIVSPWPLPSVVKFTLLCAVLTAVMLASYHYCVRYTWIGRMLNGPRLRSAGVEFGSPNQSEALQEAAAT